MSGKFDSIYPTSATLLTPTLTQITQAPYVVTQVLMRCQVVQLKLVTLMIPCYIIKNETN